VIQSVATLRAPDVTAAPLLPPSSLLLRLTHTRTHTTSLNWLCSKKQEKEKKKKKNRKKTRFTPKDSDSGSSSDITGARGSPPVTVTHP